MESPTLMAVRMLEIAREMVLRYSGEPGLEYLQSTIKEPRYLVRIIPRKIATWAKGWDPRHG